MAISVTGALLRWERVTKKSWESGLGAWNTLEHSMHAWYSGEMKDDYVLWYIHRQEIHGFVEVHWNSDIM